MSNDDRRRARLRWVTLGEAVAIAAVVISGLGLYQGWQDRHAEQAEHAQEAQAAGKARVLSLRATAQRDGAVLALAPLADGQSIQSQTIRFPAALGIAPVDTAGDPRIEAGWLADGLKKARHAAGMKDETAGDARLPVAIETQFLDGGDVRSDRAVYDLGYAVAGRFLLGSTVRLRGLSLVARGAGQARIDALWKTRAAAK